MGEASLFLRLDRRLEAIEQLRVGREALQNPYDIAGTETGPQQTPIGGGQILLLFEEASTLCVPIFTPDVLFYERYLIDPLEVFAGNGLGECGGNAPAK